jgi:hypothetical protein
MHPSPSPSALPDPEHHQIHTPLARAFGAFAAGVTVGMSICLLTYLLRAANFGPLRELVSREDRLYGEMISQDLTLWKGFHPVIFIDFDDDAMHGLGATGQAATGTPRALIAQATHAARQAGAAVIFLDYDLRNHSPGDDALRQELRMRGPPVLVPRFFSTDDLPECASQSDATAPLELQTAFDDTVITGTVMPVQSMVALDVDGTIEGTCAFYRVHVSDLAETTSREAAMLRAVKLAGPPQGHTDARLEGATPRMLTTRWWIRHDTQMLHMPSGALAYARIRAGLFAHDGGFDARAVDLSALRGAIVIISSTSRWSGDQHETPVGRLPGALINANLALELQSPPEWKPSLLAQFGVDAVLVVVASALTFPNWLSAFRRFPAGAPLPGGTMVARLFRESVIIAVFGIILLLLYLGLAMAQVNALAGWRFSVLSFLVCTLVVFVVELTAFVARGAEKLAEAVFMRWSSRPPVVHDGGSSDHDSNDPKAPSC